MSWILKRRYSPSLNVHFHDTTSIDELSINDEIKGGQFELTLL